MPKSGVKSGARDPIGAYPGTFDPPTLGHLDIIGRSLRVVDKLIVGVAINAGKGPMFSLEERVAMVEEVVASLGDSQADRVEVRAFDNLLIHFVVGSGASIIVRGLRAVSDFEYEFQMVGMNARMDPNVETIFLMASEGTQFISSRLVKEIFLLGGDVSSFVPDHVVRRLEAKRDTVNR